MKRFRRSLILALVSVLTPVVSQAAVITHMNCLYCEANSSAIGCSNEEFRFRNSSSTYIAAIEKGLNDHLPVEADMGAVRIIAEMDEPLLASWGSVTVVVSDERTSQVWRQTKQLDYGVKMDIATERGSVTCGPVLNASPDIIKRAANWRPKSR